MFAASNPVNPDNGMPHEAPSEQGGEWMVQQKKVESVGKIREQLRRSKATGVVDYRGMTVGEATRLRRRCREANVRFLVIKNRFHVFQHALGLRLDVAGDQVAIGRADGDLSGAEEQIADADRVVVGPNGRG